VKNDTADDDVVEVDDGVDAKADAKDEDANKAAAGSDVDRDKVCDDNEVDANGVRKLLVEVRDREPSAAS
jgi:hypothetical protein